MVRVCALGLLAPLVMGCDNEPTTKVEVAPAPVPEAVAEPTQVETLGEVLKDVDLEAAFNEPLPMATPPTNKIGPPSLPDKMGVVEAGNAKVELVDGDREVVIKQSRRYLGRLTYCYNLYLRDSEQDLKGRLSVYWKIEDGHVTDVKVVSNEMDDEDFAGCVQTHVMRWRYPKATRAEVNQSFDFDHSVK